MHPVGYSEKGWSFVSSNIKENLVELVGDIDKQINPLLFSAVVDKTIAHIAKSFPKTGDSFQIPIENGSSWILHEYIVEEIPLGSPKLEGNFFFDFVRNRIVMCAYGLTSSEEGAPPLLIMPGTTFPGQRGCLQSVMSAFTPFGNVGEFAYWSGKENINSWLEKQERVRGYGISQGGALLELALQDHSQKFAQANIISAPGLVNGWKHDIGDKAVETRIYIQLTDPVSKIGQFPEGENTRLYTTSLLEPDYKSLSWWMDLFFGWIAHFQDCLITTKNISIIPSSNIQAYNNSSERTFRTTAHKVISVVMFFLAPLIVLICEGSLLFSAGCSKLGELTRNSWHQLRKSERLKSLCISVKNAVGAIVIKNGNLSTSVPK